MKIRQRFNKEKEEPPLFGGGGSFYSGYPGFKNY
jgi:hypothetical protein